MTKIVTQEGIPVSEKPEDDNEGWERYEGMEAVEEAAKELSKGIKKFRDGFLFKVGLIAVAVKVVDVVGKVVMENQRLKAAKKQDEEKE